MSSVVFFHAHPDDESLLTGGTIAALAAAGHEVTVVTATDGLMGSVPDSGSPRVIELRAAARVLGARRAVTLGYADSGKGPDLYADPADRARFARADVGEAAERVCDLLDQVGAEVLVHYDPAGGYHHPDHIHTHVVGASAARRFRVPTVLEATAPRELLVRVQRLAGRLPAFPYSAEQVAEGGTLRDQIDLTARVAPWLRQKLVAVSQHTSVVGTATASGRMTAFLQRCPTMLLRPLFGREWFRTTAGDASELMRDAGLRVSPGSASPPDV